MPTYEFECPKCHKREWRVQTGYEPVTPRCEDCGPYMVQVFSPPAVHYSGSGWAKKDRKSAK